MLKFWYFIGNIAEPFISNKIMAKLMKNTQDKIPKWVLYKNQANKQFSVKKNPDDAQILISLLNYNTDLSKSYWSSGASYH